MLDPDPHPICRWQPNVFKYFFKVLTLYLEAIGTYPDPHHSERSKWQAGFVSTSKRKAVRIRIRIKVTSMIQILVKVMQIRNTGLYIDFFQCCGSGMFIPDPTFFHKLFFFQKKIISGKRIVCGRPSMLLPSTFSPLTSTGSDDRPLYSTSCTLVHIYFFIFCYLCLCTLPKLI